MNWRDIVRQQAAKAGRLALVVAYGLRLRPNPLIRVSAQVAIVLSTLLTLVFAPKLFGLY